VSEGNPAFGQIVGGKFQSDLISRQHADAIAAEAASKVCQHHSLMFQLNAEETAGKLLQHGSGYFYTVFLTHSTSSFPFAFYWYRWILICKDELDQIGSSPLHTGPEISRWRKTNRSTPIALDKSVALGRIKPFNCTLFCHSKNSLKISKPERALSFALTLDLRPQ